MSVVILTESTFYLILLSITEASVTSIEKAIAVTKSAASTTTASLLYCQLHLFHPPY
jgi:hypothetical protein